MVFLRLGLTSFGGPIAHLGYFHEAFVERRRWLSDRAYADLVALCQFLPGPASSQVGMAIGLQRAGLPGLLAAWVGFTAPSAVLMVAFAFGAAALADVVGSGWLHGLEAVAVAVVAHAVTGMARTLSPDTRRATIAVGCLIIVLLVPGAVAQLAAIAAAGLAGWMWVRPGTGPATADDSFTVRVPRSVSITCLGLFGALVAGLPLLAAVTGNGAIGLADVFYRAGALVFGGGHVVLPLLEAGTVQTGLVGPDAFLAGYGAAQAVPGPLFTFSAYLGAVAVPGPAGILGAALALFAIFLPSGLLIIGALPFWERLRHTPRAQRILAGVNAGVVGLLAAALYTPVFTQGITGAPTFALAASGFVALSVWKVPAWAVVLAAALIGAVAL